MSGDHECRINVLFPCYSNEYRLLSIVSAREWELHPCSCRVDDINHSPLFLDSTALVSRSFVSSG